MGRNEMLSDSKTLIEADRAYVESGGSFKAVVVHCSRPIHFSIANRHSPESDMHFLRRDILRGLSLGSGAALLAPIMQSLAAESRTEMPKRFVFIVKSSGIDGNNLMPTGMPAHESQRDKLVDVSLQDHGLPEIFKPFEAMKNRVTIVQGLSGNNLKGNHTSGFGTLSGRNSELAPTGPFGRCLAWHAPFHGPISHVRLCHQRRCTRTSLRPR
jgi:hypothetical protein